MLAIVQARLTSTRLPGKSLREVCGRPLLARVVDRLSKAASLHAVVVATSDQSSDDGIAEFCRREGIRCHRGPLDDVAERMRRAAAAEKAPAFVRISGDSPLIDPALVDRAVAYYEREECDLVTNVLVRSFPKGQSVEVLRFTTFARLCTEMASADDREHVTKAFYSKPAAYRIVSFTSGADAGAVNFCIDSAEDLARIESLIRATGDRLVGWRELLQIDSESTR